MLRPRAPAISIHALREEGDQVSAAHREQHGDFYPRPPRGGRRVDSVGELPISDFYPRPPRGGRQPAGDPLVVLDRFLSTPSARRATVLGDKEENTHEISIHALREEGDAAVILRTSLYRYFYPRPPRGGRQTGHRAGKITPEISIHALREEGDPVFRGSSCFRYLFLSTPSARRATVALFYAPRFTVISIHALREEGDSCLLRLTDLVA